MKKLFVVFFTIALFSVKSSFAQFYQTDSGVTAQADIVNVTDSNFAWEFVPSDDGYILMSWFFGGTWPHNVAVSYTLIDQDDNVTWDTVKNENGNAALVDFPGFVWSDYKYVSIEWSSYDDDNNLYDDVEYEFFNSNY